MLRAHRRAVRRRRAAASSRAVPQPKRRGVAYLTHGFPDGCATDSVRWADNHYHPNHQSAEGDVATAHVRKTTADDVRL